MFKVYLENAETLCYGDVVVSFDTPSEAFKFASRREWVGAAVDAPNNEQIALFKRGKLCQWLTCYENQLWQYDPDILML